MATEAPQITGESGTCAQRIMLVDDDPGVRESASELLARQGYVVRACATGAEALAAVRDEPLPDVVILDLHLPDMDGWELRLALLDDPQLAALPVLVMSGDQSPAARAIHARAHIPKPLDGARLLRTLNQVIRERRQIRQAEEAQHQLTRTVALLGDIIGHVADDHGVVSRKLEVARTQCLVLEADLSRPQQFKLVGVRQLLEGADASVVKLQRLARAARSAAEDALSRATDCRRGPDEQLLQ